MGGQARLCFMISILLFVFNMVAVFAVLESMGDVAKVYVSADRFL